jgi:hypothetical protein
MQNKNQFVRRHPRTGLPLIKQFDEGFWAFRKGVRDSDNPYRSNSMYAKEWLRGWNKSYFDNLARIEVTKKNGV